MTAALITAGAIAAAAAGPLYLKWATGPVSIAFTLGMLFEKIRACNRPPRDGYTRQ
jgi:hypothetical protein